MNFFDTSVLVSASQTFHEFHHRAIVPVRDIDPTTSCTGDRALNEFYSVLTGATKPHKTSPANAMRLVDQYAQRLKVVTLSWEENLHVMRSCIARDITGGTVYDALLVACARKAGATRIYTFNPRHFLRIAPDLADRILVP